MEGFHERWNLHLSVMGGGTLVHIDLTAADWVLDQNIEFAGQTGWYIYSVAHPNLTMSTVLHVTGVNLDALQSDINCICG